LSFIAKTKFVASARTALKVACQQIGMHSGQRILVPDFICDVIIHPIAQEGLIPVYYPITDELTPDWNVLETLIESSLCDSMIMVHYFGQPQKIKQYKSFCTLHQLTLIEDNAHGYGGYLEGRALGTFGDIGISSPRKFLGTPSGGAIHGVNDKTSLLIRKLSSFPAYRLRAILKTILYLNQPAWRFAKSLMDRRTNWNDPSIYEESVQLDFGIDAFSRWRIESADWQLVASRRRENWKAWSLFARNKDLKMVFPEVHPESCPWAMPVYTKDIIERNIWLSWGAKNKVPLFPWPSLPSDIIKEKGTALARWKTIFCFPLNVSPQEIGL